MKPKEDPLYQEWDKQRILSGLPAPSTPSHCWWDGCIGIDGDSVFKTSIIQDAEKDCQASDITVCQQIIKMQEGASNNVVNNNEFKQVCKKDLRDIARPPVSLSHGDIPDDDDPDSAPVNLGKHPDHVKRDHAEIKGTKEEEIIAGIGLGVVVLLLLLYLLVA